MIRSNEFGGNVGMMICQTWLQTIAAISAAIAAIAAVYVARSSSSFQKNSLLKKATIEQIVKLLHQIHYLKSLANQPAFSAADEHVMGLDDRIREARESAITLRSMTSAFTSKEIVIICDVVNGLHKGHVFARDEKTQNTELTQKLDAAISALQEIYQRETK